MMYLDSPQVRESRDPLVRSKIRAREQRLAEERRRDRLSKERNDRLIADRSRALFRLAPFLLVLLLTGCASIEPTPKTAVVVIPGAAERWMDDPDFPAVSKASPRWVKGVLRDLNAQDAAIKEAGVR